MGQAGLCHGLLICGGLIPDNRGLRVGAIAQERQLKLALGRLLLGIRVEEVSAGVHFARSHRLHPVSAGVLFSLLYGLRVVRRHHFIAL